MNYRNCKLIRPCVSYLAVHTRSVIKLIFTGLMPLQCFLWVGCADGPSRLTAPTWNPKDMAERAMSELDTDGDGKLSMQELTAAPGLKYCAKQLDKAGDGDGSLSFEEIESRIDLYKKNRVGLTAFNCRVLLDKQPLVGAKVRLVPESFLGDSFHPLETTSNQKGWVAFSVEGINLSVVPVGIYRVEVTSSESKIPEKYNTKTTLGVEVSSMTDPYHQGQVEFHLTKK